MAVTLECTLTVSLRQLRAAVKAVVPHCEPTKTGDEISQLARVRLTAGKNELLVSATNTKTTARAAVEIDEDSRDERFAADDGVFSVDVAPGILRTALAAFKVGAAKADGEDSYAEVVLTPAHIAITDVDALLPGLSMVIPALDLVDGFPDIAGILQRAFGSASGSPQAKPLIADKGPLALFQHAAGAYGRPLTFEATGTAESRGFAVWCGPQFAGLLSSEDPSGESLGRRDAERHTHLKRLGLDKPALAAV